MYKKILIPLDNSPTDSVILNHIRPLAKINNAKLILVHVADGYVARFQQPLNLADSEEITKDRQYLEAQKQKLQSEGFEVKSYLLSGEPPKEILTIVEAERCDLIAMSTHGHRFLKDLIFGSVAENIRHRTDVPVLMIRAAKEENAAGA